MADGVVQVGIEYEVRGTGQVTSDSSSMMAKLIADQKKLNDLISQYGQNASAVFGGVSTKFMAGSKERTSQLTTETKQASDLIQKQAEDRKLADKLAVVSAQSASKERLIVVQGETAQALEVIKGGLQSQLQAEKSKQTQSLAVSKQAHDEYIAQINNVSKESIAAANLKHRAEVEAARVARSQQKADERSAQQAAVKEARAQHQQQVQDARNAREQQRQQDRQANAERIESRRLASSQFKTYDDLEAEYHSVSTKKLVADTNTLLNEKLRMHQLGLKGATEAIREQAQIQEKADAETLKGMYRLTQQREEVMRRGAGAIFGQLGIGRGLTEIGGNSMGALAGMAASLGGAYGVVKGLKDFGEEGLKATAVLDHLKIAYQQAGVSESGLNDEINRTNKLAEDLNDRWDVATDRTRQIATETAQLGKTYGQQNSDITKASIAIEEITKSYGEASLTAEQFSRVFNYGINDSESQVALGRLKLRMGDLAAQLEGSKNTADALNITMKYLQPTFAGLDDHAKSNEEAVHKAEVAWGEIKRQIGIDFVSAAGGALHMTSLLSDGVGNHTKLLAALTIALGGTTAAIAALVIAKKIANDEQVKEVLLSAKSTAAHLLNAQAITTETGATYAWGAALKSALGAVGLFMVPVTAMGVAYEIVRKKQQAVLDGHAELMRQIEAAPPAIRQQVYNIQAWGGAMGDAKAKAYLASAANLEHAKSMETAAGKAREATKASEDYTSALMAQNKTFITNAKDEADRGIAVIADIETRLKNPKIDPNRKTELEHSLTVWHDYTKARVDDYHKIEAAQHKASVEVGASDPDTQKKEKKGASFDSQIKDFTSFVKDMHDLEMLSNQEEINTLQGQLSRLRTMKGLDYVERIRAEAGIQTRLNEIKKKTDEDANKEADDDFKNIKEIDEKQLQIKLQSLEEEAAQGKNVQREILQAKVDTAKDILDTANHQSKGEVESAKAYTDAVHALRVYDLTGVATHTRQVTELEKELQDKRNALINDKTAREVAQENTRHDREQQRIIATVDDLKLKNALLEVEHQNHIDALVKIEEQGQSEISKIFSDIAKSGVGSLNASLEKTLGLATKDNSLLATLGRTALHAFSAFAEKEVDKGINSLFDSKPAAKPKMDLSTGGGVESLMKMLPWFKDGGETDPSQSPFHSTDGGFLAVLHPNEIVLPLGDDRSDMHTAMRASISAMYAPKSEKKHYKKIQSDTLNDLDETSTKNSAASKKLDSQNADQYADLAAGIDRTAVDQFLHDFFKKNNEAIRDAATAVITPAVRFGIGSSSVLGGAPMAATDAMFGTNSSEKWKGEMGRLRNQFNGGMLGDASELGGNVAGAYQIHSVLGGLGIANKAAGVMTGLYKSAPEVSEKLGEGNVAGASLDASREAFLGYVFASLPHYLEHHHEISESLAHHVGGAAEEGAARAVSYFTPKVGVAEAKGADDATPTPGEHLKEVAENTRTLAGLTKATEGLNGTNKSLLGKDASKGLGTASKALGIGTSLAGLLHIGQTQNADGSYSGEGLAGSLGPLGGILGALIGLKDGGIPHFANGKVDDAGILHGPGSDTSDSILARVSKDEGILKGGRVRALGRDVFGGLNNGSITRSQIMRGMMPDRAPVNLNDTTHHSQNIHVDMSPVASVIGGLQSNIAGMREEMQGMRSDFKNFHVSMSATEFRMGLIGNEGYDDKHTMS